MNLSEYIINDVKPINTAHTFAVAQRIFTQLTYSHLPVFDNDTNNYIGCISENDTHCIDGDKTIKEYQYTIELFFVTPQTNWLDVLEAFAKNNTNIMPVLEQDKYIGYYELKDIVSFFNETPFFYEPGAILIIEKATVDYSFSEISQIVESNEGKLLGVFVSEYKNENSQITLKIGNKGFSAIMQTFRRYSYTIIAGHEEDSYLENLKSRSDYLQKYLNI